jgi:hypothetical protein
MTAFLFRQRQAHGRTEHDRFLLELTRAPPSAAILGNEKQLPQSSKFRQSKAKKINWQGPDYSVNDP